MIASSSGRRTVAGTVLGLLALACWSTSIAFTRRVSEEFGALTGMAIAYIAGGALGCVWLAASGQLRSTLAMPRSYHLVCGGLMAVYGVCYSCAVGLAHGRQAVLEIGIINYLWPGLTMLFSLPILRRRASPRLFAGIALAFAGAALSIGQSGDFSWQAFGGNLLAVAPAHLLALAGAVTWALYSNFNTRLAGGSRGDAAPLHLIGMGAGLLILRGFAGEAGQWHPTAAGWLFLAATTLFPVLLGYLFWDMAMRHGHLHIVVPASYATPLLSTALSIPVLGVRPGAGLWLACALVIAGAGLCGTSARARADT